MKTFLFSLCFLNGLLLRPAMAVYEIESGQAVVFSIQGKVEVRPSSFELWSPAEEGRILSQGAEIQTSEGSLCNVGMGYHARNIVRLTEDSHAVLKSVDPTNVVITRGASMAWVRHLSGQSTFQVTTPTAVASARGTGWIQNSGHISCFEDTVHATSVSKREADLPEGKTMTTGTDGVLGEIKDVGKDVSENWTLFTKQVMDEPGAEDFIYIKNEGSKTIIKFYMRMEAKDYILTNPDDLHYRLRINRQYEPVDTETIRLDQGLIDKVEIVYADLAGPGSRYIAEINISTKVPLQIELKESFFGLKLLLKDRYGLLREVEKTDLPPPLPEPADENAVSGVASGSGSTTPKLITSWNQVNTSGFGSALNADIPAMAEFNGFLYAGTSNTAGAKLFRASDGTTYSNVDLTGVSGFSGHLSIRSMVAYPLPESASTRLYIGGAQLSTSATEGSVFVSSNGTTFTELDGAGKWAVANDGSNDSPAVSALIVYNDKLYAGISFARFNAEIWRRSVNDDVAAWEQVLTKAQMNTLTGGSRDGVIHEFKIFNNRLFVAVESTAGGGTGPVLLSSTSGDSGSWSLSGSRGLV